MRERPGSDGALPYQRRASLGLARPYDVILDDWAFRTAKVGLLQARRSSDQDSMGSGRRAGKRGSAGADRAKLRLSRGFPHCLASRYRPHDWALRTAKVCLLQARRSSDQDLIG